MQKKFTTEYYHDNTRIYLTEDDSGFNVLLSCLTRDELKNLGELINEVLLSENPLKYVPSHPQPIAINNEHRTYKPTAWEE